MRFSGHLAKSQWLFALCISAVSANAATLTFYSDRAAFLAALSASSTTNFEGLSPDATFQNYLNPAGLTTAGVNFTTSGGGQFGPGFVSVQGGGYTVGIYETGTGAILSYTPPNQPGNAYLHAALPAGTTAVGADLWSPQPFVSYVDILVTATDMTTGTQRVNTLNRPAAAFFGVTSDVPLASLRFQPPAGQVGMILDNLTLGQLQTGGNGNGNGGTPTPIPEPGTVAMVVAGLAALAFRHRFV